MWKNMFLFLDTTKSFENKIELFDQFGWQVRVKNVSGDKTLILLEKMLKTRKLKITDLKGIAVLQHPGSFTSIRSGLTIANTIGFIFNIPVLTIKLAETLAIKLVARKLLKKKKFILIKPTYDKEPNITYSKNTNC